MRWRVSFRREPDLPDDRVDPELTRIGGRRGRGYVWFIAGFTLIAVIELYGYFFGLPTDPRIVLLFDAALIASAAFQFRRAGVPSIAPLLRSALADDDQTVVRVLDCLRAGGMHVISQIPGDGFELTDVIVSDRGIIIVQKLPVATSAAGRITFGDGDEVLRSGRPFAADLARQMRAQIAWLTNLLQQLTGDHYLVRGALLFPGARLDPMPTAMQRDVWFIEPRALPGFVLREPIRLAPAEVLDAANQLRRFAHSRAIS